jgi:hypothetical protein
VRRGTRSFGTLAPFRSVVKPVNPAGLDWRHLLHTLDSCSSPQGHIAANTGIEHAALAGHDVDEIALLCHIVIPRPRTLTQNVAQRTASRHSAVSRFFARPHLARSGLGSGGSE